jgi:hypothetical protein
VALKTALRKPDLGFILIDNDFAFTNGSLEGCVIVLNLTSVRQSNSAHCGVKRNRRN